MLGEFPESKNRKSWKINLALPPKIKYLKDMKNEITITRHKLTKSRCYRVGHTFVNVFGHSGNVFMTFAVNAAEAHTEHVELTRKGAADLLRKLRK